MLIKCLVEKHPNTYLLEQVVQNYIYYCGIKFINMKFWERVIELRLRHETTILENQFGFRQSTLEDIFLFRCLIKKYREAPKDLHVIFIDPEKAYDRDLESLCVGFLEK